VNAADALDALAARGSPARGREMEAYHKAHRRYLGVGVPEISRLAGIWRSELTQPERIALARALWETDVHEARIAAARLLTQDRMGDDEATWRAIAAWVPEFDAWAIADHVAKAGSQRLVADPRRLDEVEGWVASPHLWTRRAALVMTLPFTRPRQPTDSQAEARERVLGWAADLVGDGAWFIQKAIAWWLRELSKVAPERVQSFLDRHGERMAPFARREAARYLGSPA